SYGGVPIDNITDRMLTRHRPSCAGRLRALIPQDGHMTSPEQHEWPPTDRSHRRSEVSTVIGHGDAVWARASSDVLRWKVKTASGFAVDARTAAAAGDRLKVTARVLWFRVVEPVEVT